MRASWISHTWVWTPSLNYVHLGNIFILSKPLFSQSRVEMVVAFTSYTTVRIRWVSAAPWVFNKDWPRGAARWSNRWKCDSPALGWSTSTSWSYDLTVTHSTPFTQPHILFQVWCSCLWECLRVLASLGHRCSEAPSHAVEVRKEEREQYCS